MCVVEVDNVGIGRSTVWKSNFRRPTGGSCCGRGVAAAVAPESRAKLLMLEDAAHMTIFSHPTRIAEAVDELWGGALRYEEEL